MGSDLSFFNFVHDQVNETYVYMYCIDACISLFWQPPIASKRDIEQ